jgi:hypothetical protein
VWVASVNIVKEYSDWGRKASVATGGDVK